VSITCGINCLTVSTGELSIRFNPVTYASTNSEILAYGGTLTGGGTLDAKAWVFGLGDNKIYDGTTVATVSGLMPDVTSVAPPVALGAVSNANFDTRNVGTDKPITFETTFADAVYDLFAPAGTTVGTYQARADILVRPLTVTAVTDTRPYNGTTSSVGTPVAEGLQTGDSLNGTLTQVFASKDVLGTGNSTLLANDTYTVTDGNGGNNYAVSLVTAPGTITPLPLAVTATDVSKVYGQTPALTGFSTTALVGAETVGSVTLSSAGQAATASVAGSPYAITPSAAAGTGFTAGNYSISYVNGVLTVTPIADVPPVLVPDGSLTSDFAAGVSASGAQGMAPVADVVNRPIATRIQESASWPQGPVTFAATLAPTPGPLVLPVPAPVPVPQSLEKEDIQPQPRRLLVPVRPPKQDRN
jgi:hypothetical protein